MQGEGQGTDTGLTAARRREGRETWEEEVQAAVQSGKPRPGWWRFPGRRHFPDHLSCRNGLKLALPPCSVTVWHGLQGHGARGPSSGQPWAPSLLG